MSHVGKLTWFLYAWLLLHFLVIGGCVSPAKPYSYGQPHIYHSKSHNGKYEIHEYHNVTAQIYIVGGKARGYVIGTTSERIVALPEIDTCDIYLTNKGKKR